MKIVSKFRLITACTILFSGFVTVVAAQSQSSAPFEPIYLNPAYSFEERSADLVSRLTLEEKESLLGNSMAAVPRLGIKSYNVWSEALHGVLTGANKSAGLDGPTSFPNSVALGSAWDPELMKREAAAIADEGRAINNTGTKGLTFWSPVVEPVRDPRWGRTGESFGEDPFLVSEIAAAFVQGFMGDDPVYMKAVPTAKHYFANNSEFDRHVSSSNMDSRDMREFYLAPYKKLIEDDALPSIMSSYNAVNGVPTSASRLYLDSIARRTYGLNGYVTGDCASIEDIYTGHYYVKTAEEATAMGLIAGVDSDCGSVYQRSTIDAFNKGLITMADIDRALVNVFVVRMRTGEFDAPSRVPYALYLPGIVNSPASRALAKEVATRTPVLLKNEVSAKTGAKALPLNASKIKRIAVMGPQANKAEIGPYSGSPEAANMISPFTGLKNYLSAKGYDTEVILGSGGNTKSKSNLLYIVDFELVKADGTKTRHDATKYSASSPGITVGSGMGTVEQVRTIDDGSWTAYENVVLENVDTIGITLNIPTEGGMVEVHVGSPDGNLIATMDATVAGGARSGGVYGAGSMMKVKVNRLGFNGPQTLYLVYKAPQDAPIDQQTLDLASSVDVAIVFVGTDEKTATEEADRLTLNLPGNQVDLIKAVASMNKNTIVVMQTLGCVEVEQFKNLANIPGIIWVGYNGQAQGDAIAEILFGDVNPGGKLNATWYKSLNDLPAITDYTLRGGNGKNGRTLWYFNKEVSYEFGYGLSYTTFAYSNFMISKSSITPQDKITVSVDVTNTGDREGDEIVQIYMRTPDSPASAQRPIKRLKGFKRVTIPAGQTKTVDIAIDCADLWFWDNDTDKMVYDSGRYQFEVGASSKDIRGTLTATMDGKAFVPTLKLIVADCGTTVMNQGDKVQASFTASMTDDTFYDVSKAKVTYRSNNPKVAEVDANGMVTAKSQGVATIIVTVTVDGKTASDSFAVKVMPVLTLKSLSVNGKVIKGFAPSVSQYSYLLPAGSAAPQVSYEAADNSVDVEIEQAASVPGTAVIKVIDRVSCDENMYMVNFGTKSVGDEFKGSLGSQWSWVRENASAWSLTNNNGSLIISTGKGDLTVANNNAENVLLQSANTDWTIETKMVCSTRPAAPAQNAGVVAYQDDDNFVKFVYGASMMMGRGGFNRGGATGEQPGSVTLSVEENGSQKASVSLSMADIIKANNTVVLKLVKKGNLYTAYCSADGKKFTKVGEVNTTLKDIKAGVMACDGVMAMRGFGGFGGGQAMQTPQTKPMDVAFDYFHITNSGLK